MVKKRDKHGYDSSSSEEETSEVEDWLCVDNIVLEEKPKSLINNKRNVILRKTSSSSSSSSSYGSEDDDDDDASSSFSVSDSADSESSAKQEEVEDWFCQVSYDESDVSPLATLESATGMHIDLDDSGFKVGLDPESIALTEQKELFHQLCTINALQFETMKPKDQLQLMNSIEVIEAQTGDVIITEGEEDGSFYFILGPSEAQVEVVRDNEGKEEFLTRINSGQYFGEKFFLTNRHAPRNATIRAVAPCTLGCVTVDQFSKWTNFRTFLLMKEVPLIRTLPQNFQVEMYSLLKHAAYSDGDHIVKQGDVGDKFYIITDGAADVVQEKEVDGKVQKKTLVRLYEGHFFGEMALVFDEPRVANVVAVGNTSCLYLSKAAFTKALSAEQFQLMMQEVAYKRAEVREKREKKEQAEMAAKATLDRITSSDGTHTPMSASSIASIAPLLHRNQSGVTTPSSGRSGHTGWDSDGGSDSERNVTTTNKLIKRKLATGQKFINKYIILREIGRGAFGYVYLCKKEDDGQLFAMKSINKSTRKWNMKLTDDIKTEIAVMKSLRHQNVVSLLEVIDDPSAKQIYLVQEYMEGGPLLGDEIDAPPIPEKEVWKYFRDMLRGVSYMHSQGIVHRDIKPQNMLKNKDGVVKLADFGTAVLTGGADGSVVMAAGGTPAFMAPELFQISSTDTCEAQQRVVSPQVDVWGLGATLYNLVIGHPPWMAKNQIKLAEKVRTIELRFPYEKERTMDPHMKHLIKRMLDKDPNTRITMSEICEHDWVTSEGSEPLDEDYLYNLLNPANLAQLGVLSINKAIFQMNNSFSTSSPAASNHSLMSHLNSPGTSHHSLSSFVDSPDELRKANKRRSSRLLKFTVDHDSHLNDGSDCDVDVPPEPPRFQRLPSTKHQEFVAKKTDVKTDTGEVVTEVVLTNAKVSGISTIESSTLANWNQNAKSLLGKNPSAGLSTSSLGTTDASDDDVNNGSHLRRSRSEQTVLGQMQKWNVSSTLRDRRKAALRMGNIEECGNASDSSEDIVGLLKDQNIARSISLDTGCGPNTKQHGCSSDDEDITRVDDSSHHHKGKKKLRKKRVKAEEEDSSDDEQVVSLEGDDLDGMLDMLCEVTPSRQSFSLLQNKETGDLSVEKRSNTPLFQVKTWSGQTNLSLGIRFGMAELRNGRPAMEDRITACGSFAEAELKKKALFSLMDEEEDLMPPEPPPIGGEHHTDSGEYKPIGDDFAFFAVYDGHEGEYVSDYLQKHLHFRFNEKLILNGGLPVVSSTDGVLRGSLSSSPDEDDCTVRISLLEAVVSIEREILTKDVTRLQSALNCRGECLQMTLDGSIGSNESRRGRSRSNSEDSTNSAKMTRKRSSRSKSKTKKRTSKDSPTAKSSNSPKGSQLQNSGSQNFAGSTAVIAVVYRGAPIQTNLSRKNSKSSNPSFVSFSSEGSGSTSDLAGDLPNIAPPSSFKMKRFGGKLGTIEEPGESRDDHDSESGVHISEQRSDDISSELNSMSSPRRDDDMKPLLDSNLASLQKNQDTNPLLDSNLPSTSSSGLHPRSSVKLLIAHVGDCRAVLSDSGVAVQLTEDHHPSVPAEMARVQAAGGWITKNRVNGVLAVSRSFGDIMYKNFVVDAPAPEFYGDEEETETGIWARHNQVISMPDILELDVLPSYEFVLLASDGLFEVFSCSGAVEFIREELFKHGDAHRASRAIVSEAEKHGGKDNTSVVVICLNQIARDKRLSNSSRDGLRTMSSDSYLSDI